MYSKMNIEKFDIEKGRKLLTIKNINILKKIKYKARLFGFRVRLRIGRCYFNN